MKTTEVYYGRKVIVDKINVLLLAHDGGLGGATSSLLNIVEQFNIDYPEVFFHVVVPENATNLIHDLKKYNCKVVQCRYYLWVAWHRANNSKNIIKYSLKKMKDSLFVRKICWRTTQLPQNKKTAKWLSKYCTDNNITLIHSNSSSLNLGALVCKYTKLPHIWHFREFLQEDQNARLLCRRSYFDKTILKYTTQIIAVSESIKKKYEKRFPNIKVVYNGVPFPDKNVKETFTQYKDCFNIVQVGMISKSKGHDISIQAVYDLIVNKKIDNVYLHLFGREVWDFDKTSYEAIKDHIVVWKVVPVHFINDFRIQCGSIELVASKAEAFGRVTVEAMMCGLPVVGANSGGTPELISDGVTGLLYPQDSWRELSDKIETIIMSPEKRQYMSRNAYESSNRFTIEHCVKNIVSIYQDCLGSQYEIND